MPTVGNANFAWVQRMVHHLSPRGAAGIVLAKASLSTQQSGEGPISADGSSRPDLVECIVALPGQLFYGTGNPGQTVVPQRRQDPRRWAGMA